MAKGGAPRLFLAELGIVALGGLAYFLVRGAVSDRAVEAAERAAGIIDIERALGIYWEPAMQGWILQSRPLIELFNGIYFWTHMPVVVVVAVWLFWRRRALYLFTRNAFLSSAILALAMYYALPVAPPRLLPDAGVVDTVARYSQASYQAQELEPFVNPYAALPSLHFGWALLLSVALVLGRPRGRWGAAAVVAAVALPTAQLFAVVLTGNHFILDAVAGAAVAGVALALALAWRRYGEAALGVAGRPEREAPWQSP